MGLQTAEMTIATLAFAHVPGQALHANIQILCWSKTCPLEIGLTLYFLAVWQLTSLQAQLRPKFARETQQDPTRTSCEAHVLAMLRRGSRVVWQVLHFDGTGTARQEL